MVPDLREDAPTDEVQLPDGRTLAYATYGHPDGAPVVFCHGTPGSRISGRLGADATAEAGVRVIAPDRPGFGASDRQRGQTFADWAGDVAALTSELGVEEYGVVGFSGGGPYALACAAHTPGRVSRCAVVSGVGPPGSERGDLGFERALASASRVSPQFGRPLVWLMARAVASADSFTDVVGDADADLADPRRGESGRVLLADFREGLRQGTTPLATDYGVLYGDWDFDLADVTVPTRVFHGREDANVPLAAGERVASAVPDADLAVYENAGHFRPIVEEARDVYGWAAENEA
ncbi:alpha/beta hydrolase [Halobacterium sp. NMX12-1]|jgi:pimeloyl-ACP methyl ester carboxylesterase|uniref:Alpha/beta hydrolase n=1 Tax=Halobacterium sp. NMX12-1 TaxID=3166650 RepID=A0AAU8CFF9_9EURY